MTHSDRIFFPNAPRQRLTGMLNTDHLYRPGPWQSAGKRRREPLPVASGAMPNKSRIDTVS
jgi:hypothetical protein